MNELRAILDTCRGVRGSSRDAVLATVVHVTGSAYRRPGARMLILPDGRQIGSISGGCLEGELIRKAWWLTKSERPVVRVYDTTSDDDAVWEFGLGCNGVVHVLLERVNTPAATEMLGFLDGHQAARTPAVVATVIRTSESSGVQVGDRWLLDDSSVQKPSLPESTDDAYVLAHASSVLAEKKSRLVHCASMDVFIEWIGPPLPLVIFGAGHDAIPLVTIAQQLGWTVTVADGRPAYAKLDRFPGADRVAVMCREDLLKDIHIDSETAVVMMTHNFPMDIRLIPLVLDRRPKYLGLLGPKSRAERLFRELDLAMPESVYSPAGLDIGCDTPAATALSITAEIQAVMNHRAGVMLRLCDRAIHAPVAEFGTIRAGSRPRDAARVSYCETTVGSNV